jgi:hypothetical protein
MRAEAGALINAMAPLSVFVKTLKRRAKKRAAARKATRARAAAAEVSQWANHRPSEHASMQDRTSSDESAIDPDLDLAAAQREYEACCTFTADYLQLPRPPRDVPTCVARAEPRMPPPTNSTAASRTTTEKRKFGPAKKRLPQLSVLKPQQPKIKYKCTFCGKAGHDAQRCFALLHCTRYGANPAPPAEQKPTVTASCKAERRGLDAGKNKERRATGAAAHSTYSQIDNMPGIYALTLGSPPPAAPKELTARARTWPAHPPAMTTTASGNGFRPRDAADLPAVPPRPF